jgi:hypothetical protein
MDFNLLTAEFMSNRKFADKWDGKDRMSAHQAFLNDVDFYKERATELTVALLHERETIEPYVTKDLLSAFHTYMRACICFFRSKDMNDIHQKEYVGEGEDDDYFHPGAIKTEKELEAEAWQELEALCGEDPGDVPYQLADTIMMRQITLKTQPNTLDRFLKFEKTEAPPIILPQQKEIDLEHPDLKKKPFFPSRVQPPEPPPGILSADSPRASSHPPVNTPYPTPVHLVNPAVGEKSINDVRETATQIIEEILSSIVDTFETEKEPEGRMTSTEEDCVSREEDVEKKNNPPDKKKNKNKNKKNKQTSKKEGGEALHVDI